MKVLVMVSEREISCLHTIGNSDPVFHIETKLREIELWDTRDNKKIKNTNTFVYCFL